MVLNRATVREFSRLTDDDLRDEIERMARVAEAQGDTSTAEFALLVREVFDRCRIPERTTP